MAPPRTDQAVKDGGSFRYARAEDRKFLDDLFGKETKDGNPFQNIGQGLARESSLAPAPRAELVVNSEIVKRAELVVPGGTVKRKHASLTP